MYPPPHLRSLLLLSRDVELNPDGPITGKHNWIVHIMGSMGNDSSTL